MIDYEALGKEMLAQLIEANAMLESEIQKKYDEKMAEQDKVMADWIETGETGHLTPYQLAMITTQ